jgi:hypothetical protein
MACTITGLGQHCEPDVGVSDRAAEVCTGPGLALVMKIMFSSEPGSYDSNQIEHFGLSRAILFFFPKKKLFVFVLILCS